MIYIVVEKDEWEELWENTCTSFVKVTEVHNVQPR